MATPQFKVGDTVRVRTWESLITEYPDRIDAIGDLRVGPSFIEGMKQYCGMEMQIRDATGLGYFTLDGAGSYAWGTEFLESASTPSHCSERVTQPEQKYENN